MAVVPAKRSRLCRARDESAFTRVFDALCRDPV